MSRIYELKLGETCAFAKGIITRVPGGWIYERLQLQSMVFIPFDNEFMI